MAPIRRKPGAGPTMATKSEKASKTDSKMSDKQLQNTVMQPMTLAQKRALLKTLSNDPEGTISALRRPEILMDFFTDCLSSSSSLQPSSLSDAHNSDNNENDLSLAVPALSGIHHLMTIRNLDYPAFYVRLYDLIDSRLLHSKHRSRFLRHLDTFLSPTNHLPAATVASFIKKLARRCLYAPPSAIVAVLPLVYNLLNTYPQTTFMVHRKPPPATASAHDENDNDAAATAKGKDPWNPNEADPQFSDAISSSLWELDTLRTHYHPTVAGICRIIAEQFTKRSYHLDDFLDHGYATLMEGELKEKRENAAGGGDRERRGRPSVVVEYTIPKHIFTGTADEQSNVQEHGRENGRPLSASSLSSNSLLRELWTF